MDLNNHVVICGDSFCSAVRDHRRHFSQILEDKYDYRVTNLARASMSAVGICFQMKAALAMRPMAIVYARTSPARIDIPVGGSFSAHQGLKNFAYPYPAEISFGHECVGDRDAHIFSHNLSTLADLDDASVNAWLDRPLDENQRQAVKMYVTYLYDEELKATTESWMYDFWHHRIRQDRIMAIPFTRYNWAKIAYEFSAKNPRYPTPYHTDDDTQIELAKRLHDLLQTQG